MSIRVPYPVIHCPYPPLIRSRRDIQALTNRTSSTTGGKLLLTIASAYPYCELFHSPVAWIIDLNLVLFIEKRYSLERLLIICVMAMWRLFSGYLERHDGKAPWQEKSTKPTSMSSLFFQAIRNWHKLRRVLFAQSSSIVAYSEEN
jgi:hypothetical protein